MIKAGKPIDAKGLIANYRLRWLTQSQSCPYKHSGMRYFDRWLIHKYKLPPEYRTGRTVYRIRVLQASRQATAAYKVLETLSGPCAEATYYGCQVKAEKKTAAFQYIPPFMVCFPDYTVCDSLYQALLCFRVQEIIVEMVEKD